MLYTQDYKEKEFIPAPVQKYLYKEGYKKGSDMQIVNFYNSKSNDNENCFSFIKKVSKSM